MNPRPKTRRLNLELLADRCLPSTVATFGLDAPGQGPFPSDRFTVADASQLTGRRVDLPLPDPAERPSDYADRTVLNTLDGFNVQPRLSVPFAGPIDPATVTGRTVFLVDLGDPTVPRDRGGAVVGVNQVVWDPATNTLHAESDELLDQHTRYALVVTRGVRDPAGEPVRASTEFLSYRRGLNLGQSGDPELKAYRKDLLSALRAARRAGIPARDVVAASVFTTMSVTATLEKMRDQIHAAASAPADFNLGPGGTRTVFDLDEVTGVTLRRQTGTSTFSTVPVNLGLVRSVPGAVGQVAFGKYTSPDFLAHPGEYIPAVPTRTGTPAVQGSNDVYFNLFLPAGPAPAGGWPVAIVGHGNGNDKNDRSAFVAASLASHGVATIAINAVGHGFGPAGTLTVTPAAGDPVTFAAGGRAMDQNGDGLFANNEGFWAAGAHAVLEETDGIRQTVADLVRLVDVVRAGVDADGDGTRDLDPVRVSYLGYSLGSSIGVPFMAVEPGMQAAAFNVTSGARIESGRLSPQRRPAVGAMLAARTPSLVNAPGLTQIDGVPVAGPHFDENNPLRDRPPVVNTVAGAMAIQEVFEHREWAAQAASSVAYAPYLRKDPLPGVSARPVLFQVAEGDQLSPNPTTADILRAGDLLDRAVWYRNDLAVAEDGTVAKNPHMFMLRIDLPGLSGQIARGAQEQIANFFASDGIEVIDPGPEGLFEPLTDVASLEDLDYIP